MLRINLGHDRITLRDRWLAFRVAQKIKRLGIGVAESVGGGEGAIELEVTASPRPSARQRLADMLSRYFPKVSYEVDDSRESG